MFSKKSGESAMSKTLTIIAEGVTIEGKIFSKGSIRIDGNVNGEITSEKELILGKEGKINASIKTTNAIISGNYKGEMIAAGEVEVTSTGRFVGSLIQKDALLTISKGGLFKGESIISDNPEIFKTAVPERSDKKEPAKELAKPENAAASPNTTMKNSFSFRNPETYNLDSHTGKSLE